MPILIRYLVSAFVVVSLTPTTFAFDAGYFENPRTEQARIPCYDQCSVTTIPFVPSPFTSSPRTNPKDLQLLQQRIVIE